MALMKVRYKGLSDIREMSKKDLQGVGIALSTGLKFDHSNRHTLHIQDPSDDLLALFREEGTFTVTEVDAETGKDVQEVVTHTKLDDTGSTVIDGTTGQKSTKPGA